MGHYSKRSYIDAITRFDSMYSGPKIKDLTLKAKLKLQKADSFESANQILARYIIDSYEALGDQHRLEHARRTLENRVLNPPGEVNKAG